MSNAKELFISVELRDNTFEGAERSPRFTVADAEVIAQEIKKSILRRFHDHDVRRCLVSK